MPLNELRKWSTTVFRAKSANDNAQVPSPSVTLSVYRRGATVSAGTSVTGSGGTQTVAVYDIGSIAVNDTLQVGTTSNSSLTVTAIGSATSITVQNDNTSSVSIAQYARLVITSSPPTLYREVTGTQDYGGTVGQIDVDSSGFVQFYTTERYFDWIVSGASISSSLYTDEESGPSRIRRNHYNIMDFPGYAPQGGAQVDVDRALAAIPNGAALYFPLEEAPFVPPSPAGWDVTKAVRIFSDSWYTPEDECFRYYGSGVDWKDSVVFNVIPSSFQTLGFHLHDCVISSTVGYAAANGTGDAIRFPHTSFGFAGSLVLERVRILYPGRSALYNPADTTFVGASLEDVQVFGCGGHGLYVLTAHHWSLRHVSVTNCNGMGAVISGGDGFPIHGCNFEGNCKTITSTQSDTMPFPDATLLTGNVYDGPKYNAQLFLHDSDSVDIAGINIESWLENATYSKTGIMFNNTRGSSIRGFECGYGAVAEAAGSRAIGLFNGSNNNLIHPGLLALVDIAVEQDSNSHSNIIYPYNVFESSATSPGRLVMPTNHRNVIFLNNRVGGLGSQTTGKLVGVVLPNLQSAAGQPTTDVDSSVRMEGLLCYNSNDNKLYIYDGTNFVVAGTQT